MKKIAFLLALLSSAGQRSVNQWTRTWVQGHGIPDTE
jgi:hypothetical protein